jgi:hypothetical protein
MSVQEDIELVQSLYAGFNARDMERVPGPGPVASGQWSVAGGR